MQLLRFPINLFLYKQLQFTWIEWKISLRLLFIDKFSSWNCSSLKAPLSITPLAILISRPSDCCADHQMGVPSVSTTLDNPLQGVHVSTHCPLQENLVALQETCIALQEIRIDFKSQYQNWVSEMIGSLSDCFWQLLAPLALHVLAQLTPLRQIKVCLIGSN